MILLAFFTWNKKRFPPRNQFHSSNFSESKAFKVVNELEKLGYFSLCEKENLEAIKENCAFNIYDNGIIGSLIFDNNNVTRDFRYLSADGEALMTKTGIRGYLNLIIKFIEKHGVSIKDCEYSPNRSDFIQRIKINDRDFDIFNSDGKPVTKEDFKIIQRNIVFFVNEELKKYNSSERIYHTEAGGFYILTKRLFDYFTTLPVAESHRPLTV